MVVGWIDPETTDCGLAADTVAADAAGVAGDAAAAAADTAGDAVAADAAAADPWAVRRDDVRLFWRFLENFLRSIVKLCLVYANIYIMHFVGADRAIRECGREREDLVGWLVL